VLDRLRERRTAIIVMSVITLLTMTLDLRGNAFIDRARSLATDLFAPLKGVGESASRPLVNAWHGAFRYEELKKENQQLKEAAESNEAAAVQAEAAIAEYNRLRTQMSLPNVGNAGRLPCDVVGGSVSNFEQGTLEINCGESSGVKNGMAVITAAGLIGRISQASATRAKVRLLWDPSISVSVKIVGLRAPPTTTTTAPNPLISAPPPSTTVPRTTTTTIRRTGTGTTTTTSEVPPEETTTTAEPTTTTTLLPVKLETGLTRGYGRGKLLGVDLIDEKAEVHLGDTVLTSGESATNVPSLFQRDIPVGLVVEATRVPGSTQLQVRIEPLADLENIDFVTVVLYDPTPSPGSS
jgi:cell shape-determining protein MreC